MPFEYGDWITFDEVVGHLASLMESAGVTLPMIDREWEADGRPIKEQVAEWIGEDSHHQDQTHLKEKILNFVIENRCFTKLPRKAQEHLAGFGFDEEYLRELGLFC